MPLYAVTPLATTTTNGLESAADKAAHDLLALRLPVVVPLGVDAAAFDTGALACDTLGGFDVTFKVVVKTTAAGGDGVLRVNGSASANLAFQGLGILAGAYANVAANFLYQPGGGWVANNEAVIRITCSRPESTLGRRMIHVWAMHVKNADEVISAMYLLASFRAAGGEITSVGVGLTGAGGTFDATKTSYSLRRL